MKLIYVLELRMAERARKCRIIKKAIQFHVQELFTEELIEKRIAVKPHISENCCNRNNMSNSISSDETDNTNIDNNLCQDSISNLEISTDSNNNSTDYGEECNTDKSTSYSDDDIQNNNGNTSLQNKIQK